MKSKTRCVMGYIHFEDVSEDSLFPEGFFEDLLPKGQRVMCIVLYRDNGVDRVFTGTPRQYRDFKRRQWRYLDRVTDIIAEYEYPNLETYTEHLDSALRLLSAMDPELCPTEKDWDRVLRPSPEEPLPKGI